MNPELINAYRNTTYEVFEPKIKIRIGEYNEALEKLLSEQREETWMFITASNPASEKLSNQENAERNFSLQEELNIYKVFNGRGIGDSKEWSPEESFLVLGISRLKAIALGKKYGQNAIVFGARESLPELVLIK